MKTLWRVRILLVVLIIVFGLVLVFNFRDPGNQGRAVPVDDVSEEPETPPDSHPVAGESVEVVGGRHQLTDSDGRLIGELRFERALQTTGGQVDFQNLEGSLTGGYDLSAATAMLNGDTVRFTSDVTVSRSDGISVHLPPDTVLRGRMISGSGPTTIELGHTRIQGGRCKVDLDHNLMVLDQRPEMADAKLDMLARCRGLVLHLETGAVTLVERVDIGIGNGPERMHGTGDVGHFDRAAGTLSLWGRAVTRMESIGLAAVEIQIRRAAVGLDGKEGVTLRSVGSSVLAGKTFLLTTPGCVMDGTGQLEVPWSVGYLQEHSVATGNMTMQATGAIHARALRLGTPRGGILLGDSCTVSDNGVVHVARPFAERLAGKGRDFVRADEAELKEGTVMLNGTVRGAANHIFFISDRAVLDQKKWVLHSGVAYDSSAFHWLVGNELTHVLNTNRLTATDGARFQGRIADMDRMSVQADVLSMEANRLFGVGNVQVTGSNERIKGTMCWITRHGGVVITPELWDTGHRIQATAGLLVLRASDGVSRLIHHARAMDDSGRVLQSDQLTWDRSTGRISAYSESNNVQLQLEL